MEAINSRTSFIRQNYDVSKSEIQFRDICMIKAVITAWFTKLFGQDHVFELDY